MISRRFWATFPQSRDRLDLGSRTLPLDATMICTHDLYIACCLSVLIFCASLLTIRGLDPQVRFAAQISFPFTLLLRQREVSHFGFSTHGALYTLNDIVAALPGSTRRFSRIDGASHIYNDFLLFYFHCITHRSLSIFCHISTCSYSLSSFCVLEITLSRVPSGSPV